MNKISLLAFILAALLSLVPIIAREPAPERPVPPSPLFQTAIPEGQQCEVKIKFLVPLPTDGSSPAFPLERKVALQRGNVSMVMEMSDKTKVMKFLRDGMVLRWSSEYGVSYEPSSVDNALQFEIFPELRWVTAENFTGEITFEGAKYLSYEWSGPNNKRRLLISPETLLPMRCEGAGREYRYKYGPVDSDLVELPPPLAGALKRLPAPAKKP